MEIDFSGCEFLSAEAVLLLAGLAYHRSNRGQGTTIRESSLRVKVSRNLRKIGFLELFDNQEAIYHDLSIPLFRSNGKDLEGLVDYIDRQVMSRPQMPLMSDVLRKEIRRSFIEIFGNIALHSESPIGGLLCGQIYPTRKEIQLAFLDTGIGICNKVRSYDAKINDDRSAIAWAVVRGNSTAKLEGPRGLGLYLLREFLKVNGGQLHLYANKGYYSENRNGRKPQLLPHSLPGTLVDLRIQIMPANVAYDLAEPTQSHDEQ